MTEENPYFYDPHEVNECNDRLVKLIRLIYTKRKITNEQFNRLHKYYYTNVQCVREKEVEVSRRGNDRRTLSNPVKLSWKAFILGVTHILGLKIVEMTITVQDPKTKELMTVSTKDYVDDEGRYVSHCDERNS